MRLFVAVVPPEDVLGELADFVEPRQAPRRSDRNRPAQRRTGHDPGISADSLRWTLPEQWHLTLAFLPDVAERHLDDLSERLTRAAARRTPMTLSIAGAGAFPHVAEARVLWAGITPEGVTEADQDDAAQELRRLAVGVRAAATKAGCVVDGGRFTPHLTLARLPRPADATHWLRVLETFRGLPWTVEEIALVQSHLGQGPNGKPRYDILDRFRLGAAGRGRAVTE